VFQSTRRRWRKWVRSVGWPLRVVFLVAVGAIILHDFVFWGRPELFPSASRLWGLAYLLSLAWVASIVFFYINVHQKAVREKEGLSPLLYTYTRRVVGDAMNIVLTFKRAIDEDIDSEVANTDYEGFRPSLEETQRMCAAINRASQAPQFAGTWVEFLAFQKRRTEDECSRIYTATPFLEAEHLQLLIDLENCSYFNFVPWVVTSGAGDGYLSFMAKQLHDYFERARRLHEYANRHLTLSGQWEPFPPR
jgi:hypothetical protein